MPHPLVRRLFALALLACCALLFPAGATAADQAAGTPAAGAPATMRVLFIGNSYTYYNNLPEIFLELGQRMQPKRTVEFGRVLVGGATLMSHWKRGEALKRIRASKWDYVILQEQSTLGNTTIEGETVITDPNLYFWPYVREFAREIKQTGAKTVLLATWPRQGKPRHGDTLTHAYMTIGRELHALVVPAGTAWQRALTARPDLRLYIEDGSHPAQAGSYLTALTLLSALFDAEPPATLPLSLRGHKTDDEGQPVMTEMETITKIDEPTLALFRRVAWETWRDAKQAGGYLTVTPTPDRTLAPLGKGNAIAAGALAGTWRGTLKLYAQPTGVQLRKVTITLTTQADGYAGTLSSETPMGPLGPLPLSDIRIADGRLSFTVAGGPSMGPPVHYSAILSSPTSLDGRAELTMPDMAVVMRGSWQATRE